MITSNDLQNHGTNPESLTARQTQALTLVREYYRVAQEPPSYGWLARRLGVSRQTAVEYVETLRRKRWLGDRTP